MNGDCRFSAIWIVMTGAHEHRDDRDDADRVQPEARRSPTRIRLRVDRELLRTGEGLAHQHGSSALSVQKSFSSACCFQGFPGSAPGCGSIVVRTGRRTGCPVVLLLCRSVVFFRCRFPLPFAQKHAQFPFPFCVRRDSCVGVPLPRRYLYFCCGSRPEASASVPLSVSRLTLISSYST